MTSVPQVQLPTQTPEPTQAFIATRIMPGQPGQPGQLIHNTTYGLYTP